MATRPLQLIVGEKVILRKAHPCGSSEWMVTRTGADIGLKCIGCGRRLMLDRETLVKRIAPGIATKDTL